MFLFHLNPHSSIYEQTTATVTGPVITATKQELSNTTTSTEHASISQHSKLSPVTPCPSTILPATTPNKQVDLLKKFKF